MTDAANVEETEAEAPDANANDYGIVFDEVEEQEEELTEEVEEVDESEELEEVEDDEVEEAEEEDTEEEVSEAVSESAPEDVEEEQVDNVQKRINKITAEKHEERRKAEALQKELEELKASLEKPVGERPSIEDFGTHEEYEDALLDWRSDQREKVRAEKRQQEIEDKRIEQLNTSYQSKVDKYVESHPDFMDAVSKVPVLPDVITTAIMSLDNGPQLAYYLSNHLDVAYELAGMEPLQGAVKVGEINASIKAAKQQSKKPSSAPKPVRTVRKGSVSKSDVSATGIRFE